MRNDCVEHARVRPLCRQDLADLMALEKICFSDPWPKSAFEELLKGPPWYALQVSYKDVLIGYASWMITAQELHLASIAVHPKWRRKSVARNLLSRILQHAVKEGCGVILLEVRESNDAARAFYAANGFTELYRRASYYHNPSEGAIVMVRTVSNSPAEG